MDELNLVNGSRMNPGDLTSDVFDLPIYVPFQDVALLSNNQSFQDVYINGETMATGQSLSLVPMGTVSMANLVYIVSGGFTVGAVRMLDAGTGATVLSNRGTLTDSGAINVAAGASGGGRRLSSDDEILVNGTLTDLGTV